MKILIFGFFLFGLSFNSNAEWTGLKEMSELKAQTNGLYLVLKSFSNTSSEVDCNRDSFFMPMEENSNYETRASMWLAAFMANKKIEVSYYECHGDLIKAASISFK
ncbi:hypothetical protein [Teredinibacter turnerae]|nr:hypothetical protein [Teredinibacter turnerae]